MNGDRRPRGSAAESTEDTSTVQPSTDKTELIELRHGYTVLYVLDPAKRAAAKARR